MNSRLPPFIALLRAVAFAGLGRKHREPDGAIFGFSKNALPETHSRPDLALWHHMKNTPKTKRSSNQTSARTDRLAEATAERAKMTLDLQEIAFATAANEKAQRRFRNVVIISLAKIQTTAQMIHGAQLSEAHGNRTPRR